MKVDEAVERLDSLQMDQSVPKAEARQRGLQEALNVVLLASSPRVVEAYRRAVERFDEEAS